ncbi:MAG: metallophosphoesterase [Bacillota bacterium]
MTRNKYIILIIIAVFLFLIGFFITGGIVSSILQIEKLNITAKENGVEITVVHISDLHYPKNGVELDQVLKESRELNPDLIFLTGDIIDSITVESEIQELDGFLNELSQIAKTYAVHGNHESINENLFYYNTLLSSNNIVLINNSFEQVKIKGKHIGIVGLSDSGKFINENILGLNTVSANMPLFLLAHRPEYWHDYLSHERLSPLLTFSGHAHGGQFRLFGKGIYSPNQGFFPKYYDGLYEHEGKYMIVSRGLGNSIMNFRLYNKFHIPFIKIKI